jgi:hypothetical protein
MNTCPACKKEESRPAGDCPEAVAKEFRWFIDFSHILEDDCGPACRCKNCGAYFHPDSRDVFKDPQEMLRPNPSFVPTQFWIDVLGLPPELFRIIADECALGNRVCGITSDGLPADWRLIYLDGSFRDGYIVSSWVDHHRHYQNGIDRSIYVCDTMRVAVSADEEQAEQVMPPNGQ